MHQILQRKCDKLITYGKRTLMKIDAICYRFSERKITMLLLFVVFGVYIYPLYINQHAIWNFTSPHSKHDNNQQIKEIDLDKKK